MKKKITYEWKPGARIKGDAREIGSRIREISDENDSVDAETILADARNRKSPLHPCFEWDNSLAAEQHRLEQARHLIRHIDIIVIEDGKKSEPTRAFHFVSHEDGEQRYTNVLKIISQEDLYHDLLRRASLELAIFTRKYANIRELTGVLREVKRFSRSVERLTKKPTRKKAVKKTTRKTARKTVRRKVARKKGARRGPVKKKR